MALFKNNRKIFLADVRFWTRAHMTTVKQGEPQTVHEQPLGCSIETKVNHAGKVTPDGTSTRENTIAQRGAALRDMQTVAQF